MIALGMGSLSACGSGDAQPSTTNPATAATPSTSTTVTAPPASPVTPSAPTPSSTYLPSPEPELTVPARPLGALERLSGVVGEGVESGCRLLTPDADGRTPGRAVLLLSSDPRLTPGAHVTIEGHRSEGTVTTCQQGIPFTVTRVISAR